ncbi:phage integrase central domain-containing protein [Noviherbaspirillum sp.]|uniref:phage integrase central domain-containing protein n=1 Tax=Noviherbaspirillum sp. TaxID=1926288 RepID=UPI002B45BF0E|nr:integrase arm-type DNA-binding domain-containing protein [Noviherbaspirillum sp.]HJV81605.1 integrase arm-type DNA-binding domain-containing protein [Noviherbaspirillum sp.]
MLTDSQCRTAKCKDKPYKLTDGKGLYLEVKPNGVKAWRYRFKLTKAGKTTESIFAIGEYSYAPPGETKDQAKARRDGKRFTLAEARDERAKARALVQQGINPAHSRRLDRIKREHDNATTFEAVAREWLALKDWEEVTKARRLDMLQRVVFPKIGALPVKQITPVHVLDVLNTVLKKNGPSVAAEAKRTMSTVFELAVSTLRAETDPVYPVRKALPANKTQHKRPLSTEEMGQLLRALDGYDRNFQTVDDPEQRFQSIDIRKPLMMALPLAEASIVDELPKGFRLPEGELQSRQEPVLSRKVIREALANAVMHRSYQDHSPIQIIRYSNRIEILNPGYSLKDMASLGTPGSRLRNPAIAAVLHELSWAETKGSGIRTMRRMAGEAGLPLPEFASDRQKNEFKVTLFLHHLLTEEDYTWLKALAGESLSGDEAKALIYARETGAVDNTACRDFSGLDTLQASSLLRRLRDRGLLEKQGAGSRTYYTLSSPQTSVDLHPEQGKLPLEGGNQSEEGGKQSSQGGKRALPDLPPELAARLPNPGQRLDGVGLRQLIRDLCRWQPLRGEELATLLHKDLKYLRNKHLTEMVQTGQLAFLYPESPNHALQAYTLPINGNGD